MERKLSDERKKTEDLQFSIDEATFCGDELNVRERKAFILSKVENIHNHWQILNFNVSFLPTRLGFFFVKAFGRMIEMILFY